MKRLWILCLVALTATQSFDATAGTSRAHEAVVTYADIVHANYSDAHADAVSLQKSVAALLADPDESTLEAAKQAWLRSRESYGQTEVYRFYGGPIDGIGPEAGLPEGVEGPEGRINAWPLNEAFIDYVTGNESAGIINQSDVDISVELLINSNAVTDEADVTTGCHAIEFLLWGQDHTLDGPGARPISDFQGDSTSVQRRREYLEVVTDLLVDDLKMLVDAWSPDSDQNYRAKFVDQDPIVALGHIMTGMATLSGFELASERMAVALDSGDQEDEHSCFSDNTHRDFVTNIQGIRNVLVGSYGDISGIGVGDLLYAADSDAARALDALNEQTLLLAENIEAPVDRILATPEGDPAREPMEALIDGLYEQAELLVDAGATLGVDVEIAGE